MSQLQGLDGLGLVPKIVIKNFKTGATIYTYEAKQLGSTQDFTLEGWALKGGVNSSHGIFTALIDDHDNAFTDSTSARAKSTIKNQWQVEVSLGKRSSSLSLWFKSIIHGVRLIRDGTNQQKFRLFCIGNSIRNHDRLINAEFYQAKESNGTDLDSTDTEAKVSEIFKKLIENDEFYAYSELGVEGFTTTNVDDIDVKLANFIKRYETLGSALEELANIANCWYGIDQNGVAYLRYKGQTPSGFLASNDLDGLEYKNWDNSKKSILRNAPSWWEDGTIDAGYPFLYGFGVENITKDQEQTSANASFDISSAWLAVPFTPEKDNIIKIAPFLSKTGTPTQRLHVCIVGDNGSGAPNPDDIRLRKEIHQDELVNRLGSATYYEISFEKVRVEPNQPLYILFEQYADAVNPINIDYDNTTGTHFTSATGAAGSFSSNTGAMKFRTYHARSMVMILENTESRKVFPDREATVDMTGLIEEELAKVALIGLSDQVGKERRIYSDIMISPPDDPIPLGKMIRIHDKFNGLTIDADVISYEITGGVDEVFEMKISIQEYSY